jgi:hypothetical protein
MKRANSYQFMIQMGRERLRIGAGFAGIPAGRRGPRAL